MIKEALSFIYARAHEAANPTPHVREISPRRRGVTLNGREEIEEIDPPDFDRTVYTVESLADVIKSFGGTSPTVYVNGSGLMAVLCSDDRRERVSMQFSESEQATAFNRLRSGVGQKEMIRMLRTTFAGCVDFDHFLSLVRRMEFAESSEHKGEVLHGRDSLGASVDRAVVSSMGEIPEEVRVTFNLFARPHDVPCRVSFNAAVILDTTAKTIALVPIGDEYTRARDEAMESLTKTLSDAMPTDPATLVVQGGLSEVHYLR